MKLNLLGVGNAPILSVKVKTLDDAGFLLNVSALCRKLEVPRSTFLSKIATLGSLEQAILHYVTEQKMKNVN